MRARTRFWCGILSTLGLVGAMGGTVLGENPRVNTQAFRPSSHPGDVLSVRSSDTVGAGIFRFDALVSYGKNPLVFVDRAGQLPDHRVIEDQLSIDLLGGVRIFDWLSVGVAVPTFLVNEGQDSGFIPLNPVSGAALGDVRLSAKFGVLTRDLGGDGFGLGAEALVGLPTGAADKFVSDGFTFTPTLVLDYRVGPLLIAANVGAVLRETARLAFNTEVGTELLWRFGASVDVVPDLLALFGEVYGSSHDYSVANNTYVEALVGGRVGLGNSGLALTLAGGRAFTTGYGSTKYRIVAGVGFQVPPERDRDGDGIVDELDQCPDDPEDFDGFEDGDGCPDLDNDKDGIPDKLDNCPMEPEDFDGFQDEDGCPDLDNDGDGIPDKLDKCPNEPEDFDGFEDEDGCPDPDNDGDGIPDKLDGPLNAQGWGSCMNDPEDFDGFQDEDGCPEPDNDGDGILDIDDDCPNDATNTCGVKFNPCEIVITQAVYFQYDKDIIKEESFGILDAVASVLLSRKLIELVQVEGHTDSDGPDDYNLDLSQRRAEAVARYLVGKGVDAARLVPKGYGETRPIASNGTPTGRAKNRRVQFIILKPSQEGCAAAPAK